MFYRTIAAVLFAAAFSFASADEDKDLVTMVPLPKLEGFLNNYPDDGREIGDIEDPYISAGEETEESKEDIEAKNELWQLSLVRKLKKDYKEYMAGEFFLNHTAFFTNIIYVVNDKDKLTDILQELVEAGANINAYDYNGEPDSCTMLEDAARMQNYELCELLLKLGANPDSASTNECITPLLYVADTDNLPLARLLLQYGADVNSASRTVVTPLHSAAACKQLAMCRLLLEAGADPTAVTRWGETPLHMLLDNLEDKDNKLEDVLEMMRLLLASGADASACTDRGSSLLSYAVNWDEPAICRLLLDAGAPPNKEDSDGKTPLQIAEENGKTRAAEFLRNWLDTASAKSAREKESAAK